MDNTTSNVSQVRKTEVVSKIEVSRIYDAEYQKEGTQTAELRQTKTIKSFYPSQKVSNSMQDNIFGAEAFGFTEQEFTSTETRVAWIPVPVGTTKEKIEAMLSETPGSVLYKMLSNAPIITEEQQHSITIGQKTLDSFANSQVVRYPEGHENAGKIIKDNNGNVQYRRVFYSKTAKPDVDGRGIDVVPYLSSEIKSELAGVNVSLEQNIVN